MLFGEETTYTNRITVARRRSELEQRGTEQPANDRQCPPYLTGSVCHTSPVIPRIHLTAEKPVCYPVLERFVSSYIHETALQQGRPHPQTRISTYGGLGLGVLGYSSNNAAIVFGAFAWWSSVKPSRTCFCP